MGSSSLAEEEVAARPALTGARTVLSEHTLRAVLLVYTADPDMSALGPVWQWHWAGGGAGVHHPCGDQATS